MARITAVRRQLSRELGFVLPPVKVADDLSLAGNSYRNQSVRAAPEATWPIEPELSRKIVAAIADAVEPQLLAARSFAVIVSPLCRPAMARLLRGQFSDVAVLSFLEIPDGKSVEIIATVGGATTDPSLALPDPNAKDQ
ncbi:FHIPEP family type III secretion protein [Sphingorhabdus sp.]|uniref:FHIPEP family type III secretion protein n=1 Tax=Sphingorhabdus sp. TaxID=1902408 RepID=UPI0035B426F2